MQKKQILARVIPGVFLVGTLCGVAIGTLGASLKGSTVFRDVPVGYFADDAIGEMVTLGIIKGLDSAHFGPDMPLTRGQAAILFQRLRNELKGITPSTATSSSSSVHSTSSSSSSSSVQSTSSSSSSYNPGGSIHFDANGYRVARNVSTGNITIAIVRTGGNQGSGTVNYSFSGGTAVVGTDYQPMSGTLTFASKETSKKVIFEIKNSGATGDRTVNLVLKNPTGSVGLSAPSSVVLTIVDPNSSSSLGSAVSSSSAPTSAVVSFAALSYAFAENGGTATITVQRTGVTTTVVGVNYSTADGTAKSGTDYSSTTGTLSFAASETSKTFTVSIGNDNNIQGNRSFNVVLSTPTGGASLGTALSPVAINDDETLTYGTGSLKFNLSSYTGTASQGMATIAVNHVGGFGPVSVGYATNGGTAVQGTDYTAVSSTMNFAAGEASKTFTVPISSTAVAGRTINLVLTNPTNNATLSEPSTATITINQ